MKKENVVLEYFETAPLDAAEVMLYLCRRTLKGRQPSPAPRKKAVRKKTNDVQPIAKETA